MQFEIDRVRRSYAVGQLLAAHNNYCETCVFPQDMYHIKQKNAAEMH